MSTGKGIAISGIWIGVGISAFGAGLGTILIALFAALATSAVVESK